MSVQTLWKWAFSLETATLPSGSSRLSMKTSTWRPCTISSSSRNSEMGMTPSLLYPMSTMTSLPTFWRIVPETMLPTLTSVVVRVFS